MSYSLPDEHDPQPKTKRLHVATEVKDLGDDRGFMVNIWFHDSERHPQKGVFTSWALALQFMKAVLESQHKRVKGGSAT